MVVNLFLTILTVSISSGAMSNHVSVCQQPDAQEKGPQFLSKDTVALIQIKDSKLKNERLLGSGISIETYEVVFEI